MRPAERTCEGEPPACRCRRQAAHGWFINSLGSLGRALAVEQLLRSSLEVIPVQRSTALPLSLYNPLFQSIAFPKEGPSPSSPKKGSPHPFDVVYLSLLQIAELHDHPFYVAAQFHPEFKSRPGRASPLFLGMFLRVISHESS